MQDAEREKARQRILPNHEETAVTLEEEKQLVSYYAQKLIELAKTIKLPDKVVSSACTYLQRFYIRNSCLEYDPQGIVLTCLYIAAKVEDSYVSAEHIHTVGGIPEDVILKSELPVLQGLGFDLQVHPIHKALDGFLATREDLKDDATLWEKARKTVEGFFLTDAIMLFTPGQLALKAIVDIKDEIHAMKDDKLAEVISQIDRYMDTKVVDVKTIDRKLKLFLKGQRKRKRKQED